MKPRTTSILVLAAGTLLATALSAGTRSSGWAVLSGPVFLAVTVWVAHLVERRQASGSTVRSHTVFLLAVIFVITGVIMTARDPGQIPLLVASLGGVSIVALGGRER